jgi:arabinose-5-phosphate isomerase
MLNAASPSRPHAAPPVASSASKELDFASSMLESEASAVLGLRERITGHDAEAFARAVTAIVQCAQRDGTVLLTGLGKSGIIAQKISATLASLGIPSHFVHPAEAAHGDLGRFRPSDICIALSYSGETDEVVTLAAILHQDGVPVISITRGPRDRRPNAPELSSLERLATCSLTIGHVDDTQGFADGGSPAPTCSTTAMLALGDVLALCAARRRNFTDQDFAKRHPGGSLGGMLRPVREILRFRVGVNVATADDSLSVEAALNAAELPGVRR